ncbi:helix-turn-helix domain-containing protein [Mycobacterium gordonae]|uniref:helix-turn-helix domain-containing protein n=1 Tax=Mycobacterium gordonae TaxID=1778 RepID=UPI0009E89040
MKRHNSLAPFISARDWAISADDLPPTERLLLILLSDKVDRSFSCTPTVRTLAAESGAGRSTVLRRLKDLEARGLIRREPQYDHAGGRLSTRYFLNHPLAQHRCRTHSPPERPKACSGACRKAGADSAVVSRAQ